MYGLTARRDRFPEIVLPINNVAPILAANPTGLGFNDSYSGVTWATVSGTPLAHPYQLCGVIFGNMLGIPAGGLTFCRWEFQVAYGDAKTIVATTGGDLGFNNPAGGQVIAGAIAAPVWLSPQTIPAGETIYVRGKLSTATVVMQIIPYLTGYDASHLSLPLIIPSRHHYHRAIYKGTPQADPQGGTAAASGAGLWAYGAWTTIATPARDSLLLGILAGNPSATLHRCLQANLRAGTSGDPMSKTSLPSRTICNTAAGQGGLPRPLLVCGGEPIQASLACSQSTPITWEVRAVYNEL